MRFCELDYAPGIRRPLKSFELPSSSADLSGDVRQRALREMRLQRSHPFFEGRWGIPKYENDEDLEACVSDHVVHARDNDYVCDPHSLTALIPGGLRHTATSFARAMNELALDRCLHKLREMRLVSDSYRGDLCNAIAHTKSLVYNPLHKPGLLAEATRHDRPWALRQARADARDLGRRHAPLCRDPNNKKAKCCVGSLCTPTSSHRSTPFFSGALGHGAAGGCPAHRKKCHVDHQDRSHHFLLF